MTKKFQLIIRNEENFKDKVTIEFNYARAIMIFSSIFLVIFLLSFFFGKTLLKRWYDPEYIAHKQKREIIRLAEQVDSLRYFSEQKDRYIDHVNLMITGGDSLLNKKSAVKPKEAGNAPANANVSLDINEMSQVETDLRKEFEHVELTAQPQIQAISQYQDIFLLPPVLGYHIAQKFNLKGSHYGVDVVTKENEPVKAVANGTVILSNWTQETGYTIAVQHDGNMISVYKHNSVLLKKIGSFVQTGDILGIVGNTGELTSGPHLHFELWLKGNPVNPEYYIKLTSD